MSAAEPLRGEGKLESDRVETRFFKAATAAGGGRLRLWLPAALLSIFWAVHRYIPNKQTFLGGNSFDRFLLGLLVLYIVLLAGSARREEFRQKIESRAPFFSAGLVLLLFLELVTLKFSLLPLPYFPSPGAIFNVLINDWQLLLVSTLYSLRLLFIGYAIGLIVGLPTGILMGWYQKCNYWLTPLVRLIGPIPATAWIPIAMTVFPTSFAASVFIIALSAWFPVTIMTWSGVTNVSKSYYEVAKTLGGRESFLITRVAVPAAFPTIFVGLFMGLGMAFVTLVVGEMLGVKAGLGWYIQWAQGWAEYAKVYAALMVMAVIFSGVITLLFRFRDTILVWQKGLIKW
jgi:NitT/TauT family transport system permease protein